MISLPISKEPAYIASSMTRTAGVVSVNEICFRQNKAIMTMLNLQNRGISVTISLFKKSQEHTSRLVTE